MGATERTTAAAKRKSRIKIRKRIRSKSKRKIGTGHEYCEGVRVATSWVCNSSGVSASCRLRVWHAGLFRADAQTGLVGVGDGGRVFGQPARGEAAALC